MNFSYIFYENANIPVYEPLLWLHVFLYYLEKKHIGSKAMHNKRTNMNQTIIHTKQTYILYVPDIDWTTTWLYQKRLV